MNDFPANHVYNAGWYIKWTLEINEVNCKPRRWTCEWPSDEPLPSGQMHRCLDHAEWDVLCLVPVKRTHRTHQQLQQWEHRCHKEKIIRQCTNLWIPKSYTMYIQASQHMGPISPKYPASLILRKSQTFPRSTGSKHQITGWCGYSTVFGTSSICWRWILPTMCYLNLGCHA